MPLHRLEWQPGFNSQATQTKNSQGWFSCNLVRWRNGLLEKLGGWLQLFSTPCAGIVRALHAYEDLLEDVNLLIGGDGGAQIYVQGQSLYTFGFAIGGAAATVVLPAGTPPTGYTVTTHSGSNVVTVNVGNPGPISIGTSFVTLIRQSIGGIIVPAGSTFTVTAVSPGTSFAFHLGVNASADTTDAQTTPELALGNTSIITVTLNNHGLITGNSFVFDVATSIQLSLSGDMQSVNIPAGTSVVVTVLDSNNFTFSGAPFGSWNYEWDAGYYEGMNYINAGFNNPANLILVSPTFLFSGPSPSPPPSAWFLDNLGTNGVINYANGPIYIYTPPVSTGLILQNAGIPDPSVSGSGSPQINAGLFVAMPQAQIIAFGSEVILGSGQQDPLLVRFSDAGSYTSWTASASNQAGSYHLGGSGTKIVGGVQAPQTTILWTNNDIWSMQYVGPPFIYSFTVIASQCGLIAPHAFALIGRTTWWMSTRSFFTFSDSGITPVECPLWDIIFNNLNAANQDKIFAGASQSTNEVWFFYPSANGNGECDSYVKVNVLENLWDYGTLERTAWLAENAFGLPLGADSTFRIQQHEMGYDANGVAMAGVYAETGFADIADGEQIMYVDEYIQDMKWFGIDGAMQVTLYGVMYPGDTPTTKGPYGLDSTNRHIRPRFRYRQIALRFDWVARLGFSARLGTPRVRAFPAGRRP